MISPYFYLCTPYNRQTYNVQCSMYTYKIADSITPNSVKTHHFKNFVFGPGQKKQQLLGFLFS